MITDPHAISFLSTFELLKIANVSQLVSRFKAPDRLPDPFTKLAVFDPFEIAGETRLEFDPQTVLSRMEKISSRET